MNDSIWVRDSALKISSCRLRRGWFWRSVMEFLWTKRPDKLTCTGEVIFRRVLKT